LLESLENEELLEGRIDLEEVTKKWKIVLEKVLEFA